MSGNRQIAGASFPANVKSACARPPARLMDRNREYALVMREGVFNPVAVMGVEIDIEDAFEPFLETFQDRENRIVEIAEAARSIRSSMMRAARRVISDAPFERQNSPLESNRRPRSTRARTVRKTPGFQSCRCYKRRGRPRTSGHSVPRRAARRYNRRDEISRVLRGWQRGSRAMILPANRASDKDRPPPRRAQWPKGDSDRKRTADRRRCPQKAARTRAPSREPRNFA